jgi:hypothetical protein
MKTLIPFFLLLGFFSSCSNSNRDLPKGDTLIIGTGDVSDVIRIDPPTDPALDCCAVVVRIDSLDVNATPTASLDTSSYMFITECQTVRFVAKDSRYQTREFPVNNGMRIRRIKHEWKVYPR